MNVRLVITNILNAASGEQYVFSQDVIRIGRDKNSDLVIPDEKRVVSKNHAELRRTEAGFELVDLGSKNFTYLNGKRLKGDSPAAIHEGDSFRIGDFDVLFQIVPEDRTDQGDRTVFDMSYVNPFTEDCRQLGELLNRIRKTYIHEAEQRRDDAVAEALEETFPAFERENATRLMDIVLDRVEPPTAEDSRRPDVPPADDVPRAVPPRMSRQAEDRDRPFTHQIYIQSVVEVLFGALAGLLSTPWRFRHEFIGQTIVQSARQTPIYENDPEALREYLLDESVASEERADRLAQLEQAIGELALHQVAVLDGYRASVQNGVKYIIDEIDPEAVKRSAEQGALQKMVPLLAASEVLSVIEKKCAELKTEDWAAAERRVFRPAFVKAYLARMTSARNQPEHRHAEPAGPGF